MGKSRSKKQLTPGQLRSRGWTKSLMNTLLPKPRYRHFNGRSMPVWEREDVQAAEATETFQKQNLGAKPQGEAGRAAQQAAHTVSKAQAKLWKPAEKDHTQAWTQAGHSFTPRPSRPSTSSPWPSRRPIWPACWRGRTSPPSSCSPAPSGPSTPSGTSPRSSRRA